MAQFVVGDDLGSLGKFSLKKAFKKLSPAAILKKAPVPLPIPKPVIKAMVKASPLPVPKIPGVTAPIPTSIKEAKALQKEGVKAAREAWVQGPMRWTAMIDPVARKHYDHEQRVREIKALQGQLQTDLAPAQRASIEARLAKLGKDEEQYQKQGAIARTIVSVVAAVVPGLQFLSPFISAANAAYAAAKGARNLEKAEQAEKEGKRHEAEAVAHLEANGVEHAKALQVVALLRQGVPADKALQSVLAGAPAPAPVHQEWKPMKLETPEAAQAAFLQWLKGWKPEAYEAVAAKMAQAGPAGSFSVDALSGVYEWTPAYGPLSGGLGALAFWDSIGTAVTNISNMVSPLLKTYYDKRVMDVQLKQLQAGQAPMPTAQAEKVAATAAPSASAAGGGVPGWAWALGAALLGGGAWLAFKPSPRRRR